MFLQSQSIVMRDRETGRSRGFGFVTYGTEGEAQHAIGTYVSSSCAVSAERSRVSFRSASGMELDGRVIKVNLANARGSGGGPGGPGAMFQPQPFPAAPMGGFNAFPGGYGGAPPGMSTFSPALSPANNVKQRRHMAHLVDTSPPLPTLGDLQVRTLDLVARP